MGKASLKSLLAKRKKKAKKNVKNEPDTKVEEAFIKEKSIEIETKINELQDANVTIELYLADNLVADGYCHDAKLSQHEAALALYKEALSIYVRHVGKTHVVVSNTLQNLGVVNME